MAERSSQGYSRRVTRDAQFDSLGKVDMLIDQLPDGLLVCTPDGLIALANETMATMAGYSSEDLIGMPLDRLVPNEHRDRHALLRQGFVEDDATRPMGPGLALALERRDGSRCPVEISLAPTSGTALTGIIAIVRDVSERQRAEQALRTSNELLSLADERERIARDLHDTVLQRLFGLGLELQALAIRGAEPAITERVENAVDEIDLIIREIRTAVFTLGSAGREGSLGQILHTVVSQAKRVLGFPPRLRLDGPVETAMTPEIRAELIASLREALTNVGRHSGGTVAEIELRAEDHLLTLRVLDNGRGVPSSFDTASGNGLRNMAERARLLGGGCALLARPERGTELRWWVPLPR
jgi:PAS domain S-box-containing protein